MSQLSLLAVAVLLVAPLSLRAQLTVLRAARLLDVKTGRVLANPVIVIDSQRIASINPDQIPANARLIQLGDLTLLPGYIDLHAHLGVLGFPEWTTAQLALTAAFNARNLLRAGFTTVRSAGQQEPGPAVDVAVRHAIEVGRHEGPRLVPAGHVVGVHGGHCDAAMITEAAQGLLELGVADGKASGADEFAKAVRLQARHGSRVIKVCVTSGVNSYERPAATQQMTDAEIRAVVTTARMHGLDVMAHAQGAEGIKAAIRAGVRSIEHGTGLDDEGVRLMKEHGTYLIPTINAAESAAKGLSTVRGVIREKALVVVPLAGPSLRRAHAAGVPIGFGSDYGGGGKENLVEFAALVRHGLSPLEALRAATTVAAEVLRAGDRGHLAPGMWADIIAVGGDPLNDVQALSDVRFVMKGGVVIVQP